MLFLVGDRALPREDQVARNQPPTELTYEQPLKGGKLKS